MLRRDEALFRDEALRHHRADLERPEELRDLARSHLIALWVLAGLLGVALMAVVVPVAALI